MSNDYFPKDLVNDRLKIEEEERRSGKIADTLKNKITFDVLNGCYRNIRGDICYEDGTVKYLYEDDVKFKVSGEMNKDFTKKPHTNESAILSLKDCVDNLNSLIRELKAEGYTVDIDKIDRERSSVYGEFIISSLSKKLI